MALDARFQPSAAAAFLVEVAGKELPPGDSRRQILDAAVADIQQIPDWAWYNSRARATELGSTAWNRARAGLLFANLPQWAEVAKSNIEAIDGEVERWQQGESGGWTNLSAVSRATGDSVDQVGEAVENVTGHNPFDAQEAKGGSATGGISIFTIVKWGTPVLLLAAGTWYFWPAIAVALRVRGTAKRGLDLAADQFDAAVPAGQRQLEAPNDWEPYMAPETIDAEFAVLDFND